MTSLLTTPLDVVRVRQQYTLDDKLPRNTLRAILHISRVHGITELWKGLGPTLFDFIDLGQSLCLRLSFTIWDTRLSAMN